MTLPPLVACSVPGAVPCWRLVERGPGARMRAAVVRYQDYAETSDRHVSRRELPNGRATLIIGFEGPLCLSEVRQGALPAASYVSFLAGLSDTPVLVGSPPRWSGVQIDLTPLGARLLVGGGMSALAGRAVSLVDVLGPEGRTLPERIAAAPAGSARFEIVDAFLERRFAHAAPVSTGVVWAWQRLEASGGCASVADICERLGWSRRRLAAEFRQDIGLTPKALARVIRLRRAVDLLRAGPRHLLRVALEAGYYDQPHFNREFRALAGISPGEYMRTEPARAAVA